ncbi:hypothetical protein [Rossellomorea sp. BNER]|uniref:hypothetical protein n=1 Tax=Rossellomorea sp. BNER TaxID=2962031 RepID=UPI003AF31284|nr:hypothetical protein [Rossellomorea sp. BNER]
MGLQNFESLEDKITLVSETLGMKPIFKNGSVELKDMFEEFISKGLLTQDQMLPLQQPKKRTSL